MKVYHIVIGIKILLDILIHKINYLNDFLLLLNHRLM